MRGRTNGHIHNSSGTDLALIHPVGQPSAFNLPLPKGTRLQHGSQQEIEFAELSSGALIDLVRGPEGDLAFLLYRDGIGTYQRSIGDGNRTLVLPHVDRSLLEAIRWPSFVDTNDTPELLLNEIKDVLRNYLELAERDYEIVAHFILSTWFFDRSTVAPYLWIIGPFSCGKTTLLRLLSAICRRAVLAADITPAAIYRLCESLRPTLLLDELEPGSPRDRDLGRLLRAGTTRGQKIFRTDKAYSLFGPKAIVSRQETADAALASRALVIVMPPSKRALPSLEEEALSAIADQFQSRLLAFRLRNYKHARPSDAGASGLTPRMKDMARALTIPLLGKKELDSAVFELLRPHDVEAKRRRNGEPEWAVATALLECCHPASPLLTVGQLSSEVDAVLELQGETYRLTPRKIGDILRSLGIDTERLGNRGRGLRLSQSVLRLIHKTAQSMGITRADILDPHVVKHGSYFCELCEECGLMVDHEGRKLQAFEHCPHESLFD